MIRKTLTGRLARRASGRRRRGGCAVWLLHRVATRIIPALMLLAALVATAIAATGSAAYAAEPVEPTVTSIDQVIDNIRLWLL
jgi:hypothetical protein